MAKATEEMPGFIPENERKPELEKEVEFHLATAIKHPHNTKRYTSKKYPEKFADKREEYDYQVEEVRRLIEGYDGLCGKAYGWLHYAKMRDPERGKISPDFRVCQSEWFKFIEEHQASKSRGIVAVKRRRIGCSWAESWDAEHDCMTKKFFQIGMNSKSENDSRNLFKNIKFIHQNLPDWLRPTATASDRRDFMMYGWYEKDPQGNRIMKGIQSWISSVAPTDTAHEGQAYSKLIIDEAGKIDNLLSIWSLAEDCLRLNTRRVGLPIIFGTVGDIGKEGRGLMELWKNSDTYSLDKFAFYGYHGLMCDEYGNDLYRDAIRWIIYERERLKSATKKVRESFIQKYPLNERDAFNQVSSGGFGDIHLINDQIMNLMANPPEKSVGWMRRKPDGGVDFVPNPNGKIIVYDRPDFGRKDGYVACVDPVEDDLVEKTRDCSDAALAILAKPYGLDPPKIVVEYVDRPMKIDEFFEQTAMVLQWFNKTKFLPELNKGGWRMLKYFELYYPDLLGLTPKSGNSARGGVEMRHGVKMTEDRKQQLVGLGEDMIDNYSKFIPSIKFLEQCKVFGDDHADDDFCVAVLWCLAVMQSDKRIAKSIDVDRSNIPQATFKKVNGTIQIVNQGKPVLQKPKFQPNSQLFRR